MTSRRAFLKTGALVAAPVAMLAPAAAIAADAQAARLARLEDERAIEGLLRAFLARFNGTGKASECGAFVARADALRIDPQVAAIEPDPATEPTLALASDGRSASWRSVARIRLESPFVGHTTLEQMARFQGQASASAQASRRLEAEFARTAQGWAITRLALA